ncbi:MAG: GldG family protein [Gammaproteobacteria bacterium]|nr:GldG family protein [Gammaproteobacteria bacterium]
MLVTSKTRIYTRLQSVVFTILFLAVVGVLAYLSTRYSFTADWTANNRNTLSEASSELLRQLDAPVTITSYATEDESVRGAVSGLVDRYRRHKADLTLQFVNPDLEPETVRALGIRVNGELRVEYQARVENLQNLSEQGLTNILQRLARSGERWLIFVEGHGERKPQGVANHDLGQWSQQLTAKGFKVQTHNLVQNPQLPENTQVLVLAGPQMNFLPGEVALINQYVAGGGNLLWLTDPAAGDNGKKQYGLMPLATQLGIDFEPGMIVDPTTQVLGVSDPRFALVADYPGHAITRDFDALTLFPQSHGLIITPPNGWQARVILQTEKRSWSETGDMSGEIQFDAASDVPGPLTLGVALTRPLSTDDAEPRQEQRIVITGDGDFLSNAYLGNGANLLLGMNMINWLATDDQLINIPVKTATDRNLQLSPLAQGMIGFGFLFVLPLLLAGSGFLIWWKRRKR